MRCKSVRRRLHLLYYKELNAAETSAMENHLNHCSACNREYDSTRTILDSLALAAPQPRPAAGESTWEGILGGLRPPSARIRPMFHIPGRVAAALLIFALGLGTGLWLDHHSRSQKTIVAAPEFSLSRMELNGFLEDLEMVLLDTSHNPRTIQTAAPGDERDYVIDRLMFQNRQLSRNHSSPPHIRDLLEETALLLREIRNHPDLETGDPDWLPRIIEQRHLRQRIRALLITNREKIPMEDQRAPVI